MNDVILFALVCFFGLLIQSTVGFAGSLFAIPLFSLFLSPREAVPIYNLVMLLVNLFLLMEARRSIHWPHVFKLLLGGLCGIPIGAYGLACLPLGTLRVLISLITLAFALIFILQINIKFRETLRVYLGIGFLSGLLGGSISEAGPPVIVMGLACGWGKNQFRATLLAYFFFLCLAANISFLSLGLYTARSLEMFATAGLPALAAAYLGIYLKNRIHDMSFRRLVLIIIIFVSILGFIPHQ
ncbi:MAG: sulfite exporter TauE/SafE family protein [Verrucomicrobiota bacterium]